MADHPEGHAEGNPPTVGQTIQPPRKTNAPGAPAQPSISPVSGAVGDVNPVDYSSRLPGGQYIPRPGG